MTAPSPLREEELLRFCGEYVADLLTMELLAFWGRHPNCRFTIDAITCAMDARRRNVERALNGLLAEDLNNVGEGIRQLELLLQVPDQTRSQKAGWLSQLAAWQL